MKSKLLFQVVSTLVFATTFKTTAWAGFPENDLYKEDNLYSRSTSITEERFNQIIDEVINAYAPIVEAHGATLNCERKWEDSTVNAYAQQIDSEWRVTMFGGLARRPETTEDGFALVVCHELGHHLGGFPFYGDNEWAASEGQADYFASQVCARRIWKDQTDINASFRSKVNPVAKKSCDKSWNTTEDQNLCYRIAMAGYSLANLLGTISHSQVSFAENDKREVNVTQTSHPAAQCRLDTYLEGALCSRGFDQDIIPGKDFPGGETSVGAEEIASKNSCMKPDFYFNGSRPRCWFKPGRQNIMEIQNIRWNEVYGNGNGIVEPGEAYSITTVLQNNTGSAFEDFNLELNDLDGRLVPIHGKSELTKLKPYSSTEQSDSFLVYFEPTLTCGDKFDLGINVELPDRTGRLALSSDLGVTQTVSNSKNETALPIPDANNEGIVSPVWIGRSKPARFAKVTVDIDHNYSGDLILQLMKPNGEEILLRSREGGYTKNIKKTFTIDLGTQDVNGLWALHVSDVVSYAEGTLNSWSISFDEAVCQGSGDLSAR